MSKVVVGTFLSLDGVMQGPGGPDEDRSGGFDLGGWVFPHFDDAMGRIITGWTERADALLLGRRTYEIFAAHWPRVGDDDPIAAKLNSVPKHVASRSLDAVDWNNATLIEGDVAEAVAELKRRPGTEIQVTGSGDLVQTLMRNDLVDEYRLWIFPVILGRGKRLFADGATPAGLELVDTKTSATGVAIHTYRRAGELTRGSFALD
jgi:dihydrofolate reductase